MAAEFIGYSIVVTLRTPPGQVSGIVENVVNQQLILRDGQSVIYSCTTGEGADVSQPI